MTAPDLPDASTGESILAATPDGNTAEAAEFAIAAAESPMGPAAMGAMLIALGGSISDEDDLVVLRQRVVDVAHEAIDGADSAGIAITRTPDIISQTVDGTGWSEMGELEK